MKDRELAVHYYEMLTGVFNDEESKIIRYVCFFILFAGIIWAGFSYFRASVYSDTETPLDDSYQSSESSTSNSALQRVVELARAVDGLRQAGGTIASTMESLHNMPFNITTDNELDPFSAGAGVPDNVSLPSDSTSASALTAEASSVLAMNVKMIMTDTDGRKLAVVDVGGEKALVLRRGDKLPDGGFISSIRPDGISVIRNKQETKYEVPAIPKYEKIK